MTPTAQDRGGSVCWNPPQGGFFVGPDRRDRIRCLTPCYGGCRSAVGPDHGTKPGPAWRDTHLPSCIRGAVSMDARPSHEIIQREAETSGDWPAKDRRLAPPY